MGDEFRRLPRKPEIRGRIVPPSLDRLQGRRPVGRAVDLGGGKAHGIKAQPPCAPLAPRVKRPSPAVIVPIRGADFRKAWAHRVRILKHCTTLSAEQFLRARVPRARGRQRAEGAVEPAANSSSFQRELEKIMMAQLNSSCIEGGY
jgi:hypothetical protein